MATPKGEASGKNTQVGAFGVELGGVDAKAHGGWGTSPHNFPLKGKSAFPYLTMEHAPDSSTEKDTSVNSKAFEIGDREVGRTLDKALSLVNRFDGQDKQFQWAFGFQNATTRVACFEGTTSNSIPIGTVLKSGADVEFTVRRIQRSKTITRQPFVILVAECTKGSWSAPATGKLQDEGKTNTFDYTKCDLRMYEHLYEVSDDGRLFRDFRADEKTALGVQWKAGDQRTCMASLAKKFPSYYFLFENVKCYKFDFKFSPAKFTEMSTNWLGFDQKRKKDSAVPFTMDYSAIDPDLINVHFQTSVEIGPADNTQYSTNSAFKVLPATEITLGGEIPLQRIQDTESGLNLVDPVLNGAISFNGSITKTHSTDETFMEYRDNRTALAARIASVYGFYSQEILIKRFTLPEAGPNSDEVAAEPLTLSIYQPKDAHAFNDWLSGVEKKNIEVMDSPVVMRVINKNPYNEMTGRDLAGDLRP